MTAISSKSQKRTLLVSGAIILLCMTIIVGMTFLLFTDKEKVKHHLKAGDLEILLTRTHLEYAFLDEKGDWQTVTVEGDLDLTGTVHKNVFGIDSESILIVPGTYFKADLEIKNVGNVPFVYDVGIRLLGEPNELAEQLQVIVTHADGSHTTEPLSEMIKGTTILAGRMLEGDFPQNFRVDVVFIDDTLINNAAQTQLAEFDLVITATQIPPTPDSD